MFSASSEIKDKGWDEIRKQMKLMKNSHAKIGYFASGKSSGVAFIASIQEFGASINVTKKMIGFWLYNFGVRLKKKTIRIPKRPFMRITFNKNKNKTIEMLDKEYNKILEGRQGSKKALSRVGEWYVGKTKLTIRKGNFKALSAFTIKQKTIRGKAGNRPLVDKGTLMNSITSRIFINKK